MTPHPVEEMFSFKRESHQYEFFGKDRDALLAYLSIGPWGGELLRKFFPANKKNIAGIYEIEWPRRVFGVQRATPVAIYYHMGHHLGRALPVYLLHLRQNVRAIPEPILRRMAAIGRLTHRSLVTQTAEGV